VGRRKKVAMEDRDLRGRREEKRELVEMEGET